jgi:hypothetical protein
MSVAFQVLRGGLMLPCMGPEAEVADERLRSSGSGAEPLLDLLTRFERLLISTSSALIAASAAEVPSRTFDSCRGRLSRRRSPPACLPSSAFPALRFASCRKGRLVSGAPLPAAKPRALPPLVCVPCTALRFVQGRATRHLVGTVGHASCANTSRQIAVFRARDSCILPGRRGAGPLARQRAQR